MVNSSRRRRYSSASTSTSASTAEPARPADVAPVISSETSETSETKEEPLKKRGQEWRFLETEETCHFFNNEMVVSTNDIFPFDLEDATVKQPSGDAMHSGNGHQVERDGTTALGDESDHPATSSLSLAQTTYEDIFDDFGDLYLPSITAANPAILHQQRALQHQQAAQVLSAFCQDLHGGQSFLFRKRSEFLRVCFQRALDLHKHQTPKQDARVQQEPSAAKKEKKMSDGKNDIAVLDSVYQFDSSRGECPLDVTIAEVYPRKWPHLPYRDPREWKDNLDGVVTFARRVGELPEGSLLYEPVDVDGFVSSVCDLFKEQGIDVSLPGPSKNVQMTDISVAAVATLFAVAIRLQSFSLLLLVGDLLVRYGTSNIGRIRPDIVDLFVENEKILRSNFETIVPPAPYPRALVAQWKLSCYQPTTSDAIATDGMFMYIFGRTGLLKVGTGCGSTMRDFVYVHNKTYARSRDAERSWLCLIGDHLYCRSIITPSSRVDRISIHDLDIVDELYFAPVQHTLDHNSVYAMVTDGVDLFAINCIDTHKDRGPRKKARPSKGKKTPIVKPSTSKSGESADGIRVGDRIVRGPDWKWGSQDGEEGSLGTVERISTWGGVKGCGITVRWDKNQRVNTYRWGAENCYDIVVVVEKAGGGIERKPLPVKREGACEGEDEEPEPPRHQFIVTRYSVSKLLCIVDLEQDAINALLEITPKPPSETIKTSEQTESLLTTVHEHTLGLSSATTAWRCDGETAGCLGEKSASRYRCESGCDFDLCEVCIVNTMAVKDSQSPPADPLAATPSPPGSESLQEGMAAVVAASESPSPAADPVATTPLPPGSESLQEGTAAVVAASESPSPAADPLAATPPPPSSESLQEGTAAGVAASEPPSPAADPLAATPSPPSAESLQEGIPVAVSEPQSLPVGSVSPIPCPPSSESVQEGATVPAGGPPRPQSNPQPVVPPPSGSESIEEGAPVSGSVPTSSQADPLPTPLSSSELLQEGTAVAESEPLSPSSDPLPTISSPPSSETLPGGTAVTGSEGETPIADMASPSIELLAPEAADTESVPPEANPVSEADPVPEADPIEELLTFWSGMFTRKECEVAYLRAGESLDGAISWLHDCGDVLRRREIVSCIESVVLESPPNASAMDPVLLVAGSFYAMDGHLCIVSPPGLYESEGTTRSIHTTDAAWFFSLKDGHLSFPEQSPVQLKSVPAGSAVCTDLTRHRVVVYSSYLNCVEEYEVAKSSPAAPSGSFMDDGVSLRSIGERIHTHIFQAVSRRYAAPAYKPAYVGLQELIAQTEEAIAVAATVKAAKKKSPDDATSAVKVRARLLKKLRLRLDEFEKLGAQESRGYLVPYCADFKGFGFRSLLSGLRYAIEDVGKSSVCGQVVDNVTQLHQMLVVWRAMAQDCHGTSVKLCVPERWSSVVRSVADGLLEIARGRLLDWESRAIDGEIAGLTRYQVVSKAQDVLLWGLYAGIFSHFDRYQLLVEELRNVLTNPSETLPKDYFLIMRDHTDDLQLQTESDCCSTLLKKLISLNLEGGIARLVGDRGNLPELVKLLFELSVREFVSASVQDNALETSGGPHFYSPVEKMLLNVFNGCAIELMADVDGQPVGGHADNNDAVQTPLFGMFATECFQTCETLLQIKPPTETNSRQDFSRSACGKLLPLVLAMASNGGTAFLKSVHERMFRLLDAVAAQQSAHEHSESSRLLAVTRFVESTHPYNRTQAAVRKVVRIPGATCLQIQFDPRCSTSGEADFVLVTPGLASFHADRVPFGESGIGDPGGCFFGTREDGNWPETGSGISIWGDTVTITLCSTSQDRETSGGDDGSKRWGVKCVVQAISMADSNSWRNDASLGMKFALDTLSQRQLLECQRTVETAVTNEMKPILRMFHSLGRRRSCQQVKCLVSEIVESTVGGDDQDNSDGAKFVKRVESALLLRVRSGGRGSQNPTWRNARRLVLAVVTLSSIRSDDEVSSLNHESVHWQAIVRDVAAVEQWMVHRVQLCKEWAIMQEDKVSVTQMVDRFANGADRLAELCALQGVRFVATDLKRSATELHRLMSAESKAGSFKPIDQQNAVATEILFKAEFAIKHFLSVCDRDDQDKGHGSQYAVENHEDVPSIVQYFRSNIPVTSIRTAIAKLKETAISKHQAFHLLQDAHAHVSNVTKSDHVGAGFVGSLAGRWQQDSSAFVADPSPSNPRSSSWWQTTSAIIKDSSLCASIRVASMIDFLAAYTHIPVDAPADSLEDVMRSVSNLVLEVGNARDDGEHSRLDASALGYAIDELAWIGYRFGIELMMSCGHSDEASSMLCDLAERLRAGKRLSSSIHLSRAMKIASANGKTIVSCPRSIHAWVDLCTAQLTVGAERLSSMAVQVACIRTLRMIWQASADSPTPPVSEPNLLENVLTRIGSLQSSVKDASGSDTETKSKDCCVIVFDNEKARTKMSEALEKIGNDGTDEQQSDSSVCLPSSLLGLEQIESAPLRSGDASEEDTSDIVHRNVRCDGCNQNPLAGYRFKCFTCANYDLCVGCYSNLSVHDVDHQFVRLVSSSSTGEMLQPRSKTNGAIVPEASLLGSKAWIGSMLQVFLEANGYVVFCRGSTEECLARAASLSTSGFAATVMEWPEAKKMENFIDWEGIVHATFEPGSTRSGRRSSAATASKSSSASRSGAVGRFNQRILEVNGQQNQFADTSVLQSELVALARQLMNEKSCQDQTARVVARIVEAVPPLVGPGSPVGVSTDRDLYNCALGLMHTVGGFREPLRPGAWVSLPDELSHNSRVGIVKNCTSACEVVDIVVCPRGGCLAKGVDLETLQSSPTSIEPIGEIELQQVDRVLPITTSFFPTFAAVLKASHKLLKNTNVEISCDSNRVAATELIVAWLRMYMASMDILPSLLKNQASAGHGNLALLLFQLAKTSKSEHSMETLDAVRQIAWTLQQAVVCDAELKLANRPIIGVSFGDDTSCVYGPGANGLTDSTDYVFNMYAYSSRTELPVHSGRNKLLEYWEKNVIPSIESYVAGSFKSYEMDYFFAQLREPLREGNSAAAIKIAFTLCDGHVPSGCQYPDPDTDWSALQIDDVEVGARYMVTTGAGAVSCGQSEWPVEMRWTIGHSGVVRVVHPTGFVLLQLRNPRTSSLEHWWYQVDNLAAITRQDSYSERSVLSYSGALADLVKVDLDLIGVIARKCVFAMLKQDPDQFPLVSDRQSTKNHFNIVDILRMAAAAELGCETETILGEPDCQSDDVRGGNEASAVGKYELMESLRFVLTKRFEFVPPPLPEDATAEEQQASGPLMTKTQSGKMSKSGKVASEASAMTTKPAPAFGIDDTLAAVKYRYNLMEALVHELKRALDSSATFLQQNAFMVASDSPPKPMILLHVPGASCLVISFAVHPVLMDLPAGSSLEFFQDENCTKRIFGYFGEKKGLNYLPPLVIPGDRGYVRATQAAYARYKFRVDPLTCDFGLALWIAEEVHTRVTTISFSGFELESIVSSVLNSLAEYLTGGVAVLAPCTKGVVCQLLTTMTNFAISRSLLNAVPSAKLAVLTRDLAVAYDHEVSAQKRLFSLPTQQLTEFLAVVEEVSRLKGAPSFLFEASWWPSFVRMATFMRVLTHKRESPSSPDPLARISCGRAPMEDVEDVWKMLQTRDLVCDRMVLLQKLPSTNRIGEMEAALSRFIQHIALEECGEVDDQTVFSATEVLRFGILAKVVHLPVDEHGMTLGYAVVDVGRNDIIEKLVMRLQKETFQFEGKATEEDATLAEMISGLHAAKSTDTSVDETVETPGSQPATDDGMWPCGVCTLENPLSEVECAACGSPMPAGLAEATRPPAPAPASRTSEGGDSTPQQQDGGVVDGAGATGWPCEACTLVNPWDTFECGACGSERDPSLVTPVAAVAVPSPSSADAATPTTEEATVPNADGKTTLHSLVGMCLTNVVSLADAHEVKQVTSFLIDVLTENDRKSLSSGLTAMIKRELSATAFDSHRNTKTSGDSFTRKIAHECGLKTVGDADTAGGTSALDKVSQCVLELVISKPSRVYSLLRECGYDLHLEKNHYTSVDAARASQAKWTSQMDIQLITLVRQLGAQIGVLSLMDLCPSHINATHAVECASLATLESRDLRLRFALLKVLNKRILDALPLVNLRNATDPNGLRARFVTVRQLLFPALKIRFFGETQDHAILAQSNLVDATAKRPVVTLDRRCVVGRRSPGVPIHFDDPTSSLFASTMAQLSQEMPSRLRAKRPTGASDPFVAFIVIFAGENVVGEGGPYRQLFNDIAAELLSPGNPLFVPTQNSVMKIGEFRDRFLPKPSNTSKPLLAMYEFVGVLMGCCVRTGVRLNLRLAPIVWKMLVKQNLTVIDLEQIDWSVCESLKFVDAAAASESGQLSPSDLSDTYYDSFTTTLSDGTVVELKPGGANVPVTKANCKEYVRLVKNARLQECKAQVDAMLRGIGKIVPIHLLQLCTWSELQQWVCGSLAIDVELLKRHTLYSSGMTPDKFPHLEMFWRVLSNFSEDNKRRFVNFAWGQDTLPADDAEFDRTHTRLLVKAPPVTAVNQDLLLPKADTCFFNIELPAYTTEEIMREKLLLAITLCTSMDGDEQTGRMDFYISGDGMDDDDDE